jgi:hypothetical protein
VTYARRNGRCCAALHVGYRTAVLGEKIIRPALRGWAARWWYIMPIVFITYSLAYLDRANFSFASAAGITEDLGIHHAG